MPWAFCHALAFLPERLQHPQSWEHPALPQVFCHALASPPGWLQHPQSWEHPALSWAFCHALASPPWQLQHPQSWEHPALPQAFWCGAWGRRRMPHRTIVPGRSGIPPPPPEWSAHKCRPAAGAVPCSCHAGTHRKCAAPVPGSPDPAGAPPPPPGGWCSGACSPPSQYTPSPGQGCRTYRSGCALSICLRCSAHGYAPFCRECPR